MLEWLLCIAILVFAVVLGTRRAERMRRNRLPLPVVLVIVLVALAVRFLLK